MEVMCVASNVAGAGKTALARVMAKRCIDSGKKVAYVNPGIATGTNDPDTAFVDTTIKGEQETLLLPFEGADSGSTLAGSIDEMLDQAEAAASKGSADQKLILELPNADSGDAPWKQCVRMAERLNCGVVAIFRYNPGVDYAELEQLLEPVREHLSAFLVNMVPRFRIHGVIEAISRGISRSGTPLLGVLPEDRIMLAPTVGQLARQLDAQWVLNGEKGDNLVSRILIGGNIMDSGVTYFQRYPDQAVVVRGDRPDIQLAALRGPIACLVLTGGHQPIPYVYHEAEQKEVPLLVVEHNTMSIAEALNSLPELTNVRHSSKAERFDQLLSEHGSLETLDKILG